MGLREVEDGAERLEEGVHLGVHRDDEGVEAGEGLRWERRVGLHDEGLVDLRQVDDERLDGVLDGDHWG